MISVRELRKTYAPKGKNNEPVVAVDGVDFDVADGEIVGFLGPNGAGKTTTLRMLAWTARPGILIPMNFAPTWLQGLSKINPLTYIVNASRDLVVGDYATSATISGLCVAIARPSSLSGGATAPSKPKTPKPPERACG